MATTIAERDLSSASSNEDSDEASSPADTDDAEPDESQILMSQASSRTSTSVREVSGAERQQHHGIGKKRARGKDSDDDHYQRLLYRCRKDLTKQLKVCKTFETRKLIRRMKQQEGKKSEKNEQSLSALKELKLEPLVNECFRRLGLTTSEQQKQQQSSPWTAKLLHHKRLRDCLESLSNNQIAKYRQWQSRGDDIEYDAWARVQKRKHPSNSHGRRQHDRSLTLASSLFVTLGVGDTSSVNCGDPEVDDPFAEVTKTKKKRPGQRARKAKALALEAKAQGKVLSQSYNWRGEPKDSEGSESRNHSIRSGPNQRYRRNSSLEKDKSRSHPSWRAAASQIKRRTISSSFQGQKKRFGEVTSTEESLHPSWQAARSAKKEGMATFQGKKITFGDSD